MQNYIPYRMWANLKINKTSMDLILTPLKTHSNLLDTHVMDILWKGILDDHNLRKLRLCYA